MLATMLFTMNTERKMDMNEKSMGMNKKSWKPIIIKGWGGAVPRPYIPIGVTFGDGGGSDEINKEYEI